MTRRRSRAPGRVRPDRRRSILILCLGAILIVAACGGTSDATVRPSGDSGPTAAPSEPTAGPGATDEPTATPASAAPTTPDPATLEPVTPEPSTDPSASPSSDPGAAAACSGSDDNRAFFASIADGVDWPVYCAVLPSGWFVDAGRWGLAGGGWLVISYQGPGGARIELREGVSCEGGCLPSGQGTGTISAFGDQDGELFRVDDGRLAVVVDQDGPAALAAIGSGLDEPSLRAIAAGLARVGG